MTLSAPLDNVVLRDRAGHTSRSVLTMRKVAEEDLSCRHMSATSSDLERMEDVDENIQCDT